MKITWILRGALASALFASPLHAFACATCGCSLSSDAAMGYSSSTGWRVNLQYDFLDQNQLRTGSRSVSSSNVAGINDAGAKQEVEHDTINRYTTLGISYAVNAEWNFNLQVPYIDRGHTTYGESTNPLTPDLLSGANATGLGDMKFIANFQGLLPMRNLGLQLGIKLPTGKYGGPNTDGSGTVGHSPTPFTTGPNSQASSPNNLLDTSLNPGTGSTDLIVGAYYFQPISQDFDAFVNGQFQAAIVEKLDQRGADFRPGNQAALSFGVRYEADPKIVPQLQVNISKKRADQGALADIDNTAGTVVYVSPGVTFNVWKSMQFYGFVQLPAYSKLDGYQLSPRWTASAGLSYTF